MIEVPTKKTILKLSQSSQETPLLESLFNEVAVFQACNFNNSNSGAFL